MAISVEQTQRIHELATQPDYLQAEDAELLLALLAEVEQLNKFKTSERDMFDRLIREAIEHRDVFRHALQTIIEVDLAKRGGKDESRDIPQIAREAMKLSDQAYETTRAYWESRIDQAADQLPIEMESWFKSSEFDTFIYAWHDLEKFYTTHLDTEIGVRVIMTFIEFMRLLRRKLLDSIDSNQLNEDILDAISELEGTVEHTLWEAGTNIGD